MIKHIKCDIFESGADAILHQVNCQGVMGSGIAKQVRERFPEVYINYKRYCNEHEDLLGRTFPVLIDPKHGSRIQAVFNLFAQNHYGYDGKCYTDYEALKKCLYDVKQYTGYRKIAIPYKMSCHRGGGDWNVVYKMIEEVFGDSDCDILICEYDGG